jgi:iron complex transport system ATP-binding protein
VKEALSFDCVRFAYGSHPVLSGLSFELPESSLLALVGPNGAGKSTLLRLGAGLLPASEGTVRVAGQPMDTWPRRELARTVAFVPQDLHVPFPFTVEQIVAEGRTPYTRWFGGRSQADRAAVERALELTGVAPLRTRNVNRISGGEQQKVKLAIALAQESRVLLLDEPLQHLDIGNQSEFLELLLRLHRHGLTIVCAMHDLPLVSAHFPLALLLTRGAGYNYGPTERVLTREHVVAAFNLAGREFALPNLPEGLETATSPSSDLHKGSFPRVRFSHRKDRR